MIRIGHVVETDPLNHKIRVQFKDLDGMISYWIPVATRNTKYNKDYCLPDIGEMAVVGFLDETGIEDGICLGVLFNSTDKPPVNDQNITHLSFKDGTVITYDRKNHLLKIVMSTGEVQVTAPTIKITGDLQVTGNITSTGSIIDSSGNTNHHTH